MTNKDHIKLLQQGIAGWNAWRRESPGICPDFRSMSLVGAKLRGADLRIADLLGADLLGADLREADLLGANLRLRERKIENRK